MKQSGITDELCPEDGHLLVDLAGVKTCLQCGYEQRLHHTWISADNTERDERIRVLYSEGKSYKEIAKKLGITAGVVQLTFRRWRHWGELPPGYPRHRKTKRVAR